MNKGNSFTHINVPRLRVSSSGVVADVKLHRFCNDVLHHRHRTSMIFDFPHVLSLRSSVITLAPVPHTAGAAVVIGPHGHHGGTGHGKKEQTGGKRDLR